MILYILAYTALASSLLPLIIGGSRWKYFNTQLRYAYLIVVLQFTADMLSLVTAMMYGRNWFIFPFTTLLYFIPVILFFKYYLGEKVKDFVWWIIIGTYLISQVLEAFFSTGIDGYVSYTRTLIALTVVTIAIISLVTMARKSSMTTVKNQMMYVNILNQPVFWVTLGVLFYYGGNLPNSILGNYLTKNAIGQFYSAHAITTVILILYRILLTIGMMKISKTRHLSFQQQ